ncbi:MAG: hypothetical protein QOI27_3099 [Gaiellaceae bacterium]|jgi:hypothetical protein|nr:hypothetical protein [Gaiellaceae bacterium]MDX6472494.1 hypothetical protein [Gaiellaceae bacterium]
MNDPEQVVEIAPAAASFTIVCDTCAGLDAAEGISGSTFAGRLDLDLDGGTFLCRRGHTVRVERAAPPGAATAAA